MDNNGKPITKAGNLKTSLEIIVAIIFILGALYAIIDSIISARYGDHIVNIIFAKTKSEDISKESGEIYLNDCLLGEKDCNDAGK